MRNWAKTSFLLIFITLVGIQFIPIQRNDNLSELNSDFIKLYKPAFEIENLLRTSCYDCHSNHTNYPWYTDVQPIGWLMQNHISEGKSELNFSSFGDLSTRMKRTKLKSIISQIDDDKMPLPSYLLIHNDAKLDQLNKTLLEKYLDSLLLSINNKSVD